jgi:lantibiotic modifying enzyme
MGFAHGRSGAGLAFARLFGATGDPEFEGAALRAFERERRLVLSWLNEPGSERARTVSRPWTVSAWCNGPPGMALARALALDHLDHPAVRQDLEMALDAVLQPIGRRSDHLCCGNLGVADVLWTIGARLGRQEVGETALRLADQCLHRARRRGHFVLSASPFENRVFDPGFFRGLSGIGYQLLRLSCPQRLPSVLAFETRGASTGRCLADPTEA